MGYLCENCYVTAEDYMIAVRCYSCGSLACVRENADLAGWKAEIVVEKGWIARGEEIRLFCGKCRAKK